MFPDFWLGLMLIWVLGVQLHLKRVVQVEKAMEFFTPEVVVHLDGSLELQEVQGRDRLMEAVRGTIISVNRLRIERYDTRTIVPQGSSTGTVTMTVFVHVDGLLNPHIQMVRLSVEKSKGEWRIAKVESVNPIR